jgi:hypothetical protein
VSTPAVSLDTVGEPALWPDSGSVGPTEIVNIIRQPSPPPILAAVQALQEGLNSHDHVHPQPHPSDVADPRPGPPQVSDDAFTQSKGPKSLHISTKMMDDFMQRAKANTLRNLETCGVLAGSLVSKILLPAVSFRLLKCDQIPLMNIKHPAVKYIYIYIFSVSSQMRQ